MKYFWTLLKRVKTRGFGNLPLLKLSDFLKITESTLQIYFFWDLHNKRTLHSNDFNSLDGTKKIRNLCLSGHAFFCIFLCECELCQLYHFQNAYSFGIFLCKVSQLYRFQSSHSFSD